MDTTCALSHWSSENHISYKAVLYCLKKAPQSWVWWSFVQPRSIYTSYTHTIFCPRDQWGSLAAGHSLLKVVSFTTSHTRIRISTTGNVSTRIRYYKSRACVWTCNEIEGLYHKIIITIVPSYTRKKYHSLVAVGIDDNKLMIFSGIALYYGDTYIL